MPDDALTFRVQLRGLHVGLLHWSQPALRGWLQEQAQAQPALAARLQEPAWWWRVVGRPVHTTDAGGESVATYTVQAVRRTGHA
jgi:hypothetical protein